MSSVSYLVSRGKWYLPENTNEADVGAAGCYAPTDSYATAVRGSSATPPALRGFLMSSPNAIHGNARHRFFRSTNTSTCAYSSVFVLAGLAGVTAK